MSGPAPAGGATVSLISDDLRVIQVPATVFVAAGASTATFTAMTLRPIPNSLTGTVRAFHQGSTANTTITVLRVPRVGSVALNPPSVTGGNTTSATVSIDITTGVDTVVALSSTNTTVAPVPASVTVPAGSTTATVNITTASVLDDTSATISATYRGTATGVLAVTAVPVTVSSVVVNPTNVVGGRVNATGTVTLNRITGANGAVVSLSSSNTSLAAVPSTVAVPSGAANASFTVTTGTSSAATPVTVTATYGTTQNATLTVASCNDWTPGAATIGGDTVWFDDGVPAGAALSGTWAWDATKMASGTQSHVTLTTGTDAHSFDNYPNYFHFNIGDWVTQYVLVDPCNPPAEIMLQFGVCCDGWMHRAFWGQDLLNNPNYGMLGKDRIYMGPIPAGGQWVKLTAPASQMQISGPGRGNVYGVEFDVAGAGHAWFDRTGKESCTVLANIARPSSFPSTDVVWFDDTPPTGASLAAWTWDTTQAASGTKSHNDPSGVGFHNHYFQGASQTITPGVGDSLFTYVLIDPCDPPNEVIVYWNDGSSWNHIAYWGPEAWNCGAEGPGCHYVGALPAFGGWVRLSVPASAVGLEGHTLNGMAFAAWNGHAWFDRAGIQPAGSGALQHPAVRPATVTAEQGATRSTFLHRMLARWRREPNPVNFSVNARFTGQPAMVGPTRQYSFYTPELQLLSETSLTDAASPAVVTDYVSFGGVPLAQISSAGDIAYSFNDHLGAPILQTSATGAVVWRAERDPYGTRFEVRTGGDRDQRLGLPGQEAQPASPDLQYNMYRWYRPGWGRYSQSDPIALRGGMNLYAYGSSNPLAFDDPSGLSFIDVRKVDEHRYNTLQEYQAANPCHQHGTSYSCTERLLEDIGCPCSCKGTGWGMDVSIIVQVRYQLAGGPPNTNLPPAVFWNGYRRHENLHFDDLRAELKKYADGLEAQRFADDTACNVACGKAIGGFHEWLNNWAAGSNQRLH